MADNETALAVDSLFSEGNELNPIELANYESVQLAIREFEANTRPIEFDDMLASIQPVDKMAILANRTAALQEQLEMNSKVPDGLNEEQFRDWMIKREKLRDELEAGAIEAENEVRLAEARRQELALKNTYEANRAREAKLKNAEKKVASRLWLKKDHSILEYIKKIDGVVTEIQRNADETTEKANQ